MRAPRLRTALAVGGLAGVALFFVCTGAPRTDPVVRIYPAAVVRTLEATPSEASAVAVRHGRIVGVGDRDALARQFADVPHMVDERFAELVLMPGFIDPHVHPSLGATILGMDIVSAMEWATPQGRTKAVRGREAFLARLRELDGARPDDDWLLVWGYHAPYHGELRRADLDAISTTRPILVWQRSVHEMFFNARALAELGADADVWRAHPQADWEEGHLWEAGTLELAGPMLQILASPGRYRRGLDLLGQVVHRGGLTTLGEQGFPQVSAFGELLMLHLALRGDEAPYRIALVPNAMFLLREHGDPERAERAAQSLLRWSTDRVRIVRHAKTYADGAIFSQLMQMTEPYLDGHHGEWMMPPDEHGATLAAFWKQGWDLHVHVNGDAGLDLVLDQIEALQRSNPDPERRVVLEHVGIARDDQHERIARLGIAVSNNAYYPHELAPIYAEHGLGPERAARISPLGGLEAAGVSLSFHSDFPMAPAEPLRLAWVAANRVASDGRVWGPEQRTSPEKALRAITLDAAWSLGLEDEIGSIRVGKRADFTVLHEDPFETPPSAWKDIHVWGTVLDGRVHPLPAESSGP